MKCVPLLVLVVALAGCQSMYYGTMEKFGVHKREILVERVEEGRTEQAEASEAFQSALERFTAVVQVDGGELQAKYDELSDQLERRENRANKVSARIESIESVAKALFVEWEDELEEYSSPDLRARSARTLGETRRRYADLIAAMRKAEAKMPPVLTAFNDQVLYLKHNLNARAIASLQGDVSQLEGEIAELVAEMNRAIAEADEFIAEMSGAP